MAPHASLADGVRRLRNHQAWRDSVEADAKASVLLGKAASEAQNPGLHGAIVAHPRLAPRGVAAERDHHALAALDHPRQHRARHRERRAEVESEGASPAL